MRQLAAARDTVDRLRNAVHRLGAKVGGATRDQRRHPARRHTRQQGDHPARARRGVRDPGPAPAGTGRTASADADRGAVVRRVTGVCGLVFTHLFGFEGADSGFPLTIFIFLVALGVDYNIFLTTRVREESQRLGTRRGVLRGLTVTGGVITSAGPVLAATFAALATLPLTGLVEMAFAVTFGVLLDTLIVRSLLVPAPAYDIGARIW
jgi:hypothetical protein